MVVEDGLYCRRLLLALLEGAEGAGADRNVASEVGIRSRLFER